MLNKVLFVFEGDKTEEQVINSLQKYFVNENTSIKCIYGAEIYQIYREIKTDEDLDTFNLLKERNKKNQELLKEYTREDFAEIYLFFDYDGHSSMADDKKVNELLDFFQEETDKGKLYLSYPMVESLKHICDFTTFQELAVECKKNIRYKAVVGKDSLKELINFNRYSIDIWKSLISAHLKKANFIIQDRFEFPTQLLCQLEIFDNQLQKYITPFSQVSVLSGFPMFIHDYYGNKKTIELISKI
ncbi:hypothetical protein ACI513_20380 [Chryseobacterium sp. M5]|uniref:hypothetical protein n=1 Tax=Chryseobacterium sp. M5 TaxID=3379128 RepID=UPI00385724EF